MYFGLGSFLNPLLAEVFCPDHGDCSRRAFYGNVIDRGSATGWPHSHVFYSCCRWRRHSTRSDRGLFSVVRARVDTVREDDSE